MVVRSLLFESDLGLGGRKIVVASNSSYFDIDQERLVELPVVPQCNILGCRVIVHSPEATQWIFLVR
jgi:hypothetical protein